MKTDTPGTDAEYSTVLVSRVAGVATVTFNRPEKRNAMNPVMHVEMVEVLEGLATDPETRVVVITGAGKSFSSGMDLKEYFQDLEHDQEQRDLYRRLSTEWGDRMLRMFPKPTIAMVNGYCFGGAFTIVASCDIAIAADEAVFGLSEVNLGYMPGGLVAKSVASLMPYRDAVYYAMTGEQFDGPAAARLRFVNSSVPRAGLESEVAKSRRSAQGIGSDRGAILQRSRQAGDGHVLRRGVLVPRCQAQRPQLASPSTRQGREGNRSVPGQALSPRHRFLHKGRRRRFVTIRRDA